MVTLIRCVILLTLALGISLFPCHAEVQVAKLYPVDEASKDPSFFVFRARLLKAIQQRDAGFLVSILSPRIQNSFGGDGGVAEFRQMWRPERSDSKIWSELISVLALGGKFGEDGRFMAPYTINFPEQFDAFEYGAIIGENVRVRREPKSNSPVLHMLSYDIVKVTDWTPTRTRGSKQTWIAVALADGQRGHVAEDYIRSPIDYRALFEKQGGRWVMTSFLAGD